MSELRLPAISDEEREASDGELATRCKAYDARWATLSSQLSSSGVLRILSVAGPSVSHALAKPMPSQAVRELMLEDVFDACDDDGSGALSLDEFGQLFEQVDESTKAMFNEVDSNGDKEISLEVRRYRGVQLLHVKEGSFDTHGK